MSWADIPILFGRSETMSSSRIRTTTCLVISAALGASGCSAETTIRAVQTDGGNAQAGAGGGSGQTSTGGGSNGGAQQGGAGGTGNGGSASNAGGMPSGGAGAAATDAGPDGPASRCND